MLILIEHGPPLLSIAKAVKAASIRVRLCRLGHYFDLVPDKLPNGRLRWPTRAPEQGNGHSWLARQLTAVGVGYAMADNAFIRVDD